MFEGQVHYYRYHGNNVQCHKRKSVAKVVVGATSSEGFLDETTTSYVKWLTVKEFRSTFNSDQMYLSYSSQSIKIYFPSNNRKSQCTVINAIALERLPEKHYAH